MATNSFFDRVVDILNTPLPGTKSDASGEAEQETILDKIKKGLDPERQSEATETEQAPNDDELVDFGADFDERDYRDDDDDDDDLDDDPEEPVAPSGRRRVEDALKSEHERELRKMRDEHAREMAKLDREREREARKRERERAKDQRERTREAQKREREELKERMKEARKARKKERAKG